MKDTIVYRIALLVAVGIPLAIDRPVLLAVSLPLLVVIGSVYEVVLIAVWGQTLGKRLQGIMVVSDDEGLPPGLRRSFIRFMSASAACLPLICLFYPFGIFRSDRRMWHDRRSGTIVIRIR